MTGVLENYIQDVGIIQIYFVISLAIYEYSCIVLLSLSLRSLSIYITVVVILYIDGLVKLLLSLFLLMLTFMVNKDECIAYNLLACMRRKIIIFFAQFNDKA